MNSLSFPKNYKLLNLTPYKFTLCTLITNVIKDEQLRTEKAFYIYLDLINKLINDFECEISKKILCDKITIYFNKINYNIDAEQTEIFLQSVLNVLDNSLAKIQNLQDLYFFFNNNIRELKHKDENGRCLIENGGIIDHFIRKCIFAFYKLSFEDLVNLFNNIISYSSGENVNISLTTKESDLLFEKQINELTFNPVNDNGIDKVLLESRNYRQKYFFESKDTLGKIFI
jgi:hypothetical protein